MKKSLLTVLAVTVFFISFAHAQTKNSELEKNLTAQRTQNSFKIDGELNEGDWMQAPIATDFVQNQPNPGINPTQKSEVKVLYDNTAIYVSAVLYDENPKEIPQELSLMHSILCLEKMKVGMLFGKVKRNLLIKVGWLN